MSMLVRKREVIMKELVKFIAQALVDHPEQVTVNELAGGILDHH